MLYKERECKDFDRDESLWMVKKIIVKMQDNVLITNKIHVMLYGP